MYDLFWDYKCVPGDLTEFQNDDDDDCKNTFPCLHHL